MSSALRPNYRPRLRTASSDELRRKALQYLVVGLLALAVLWVVRDLVVSTLAHFSSPPSLASANTYPVLAAESFASGFALAYETYDSSQPDLRQSALRPFVAGDDLTMGWDGTGHQTARQAMATGITFQEGGRARVVVAVLVDNARWVYLSVPVIVAQGGIVVAGTPALLPAPSAATVPPPAEVDTDPALAEQLRPTASAFMRAYASSNPTDLSYFSAPGVTFRGLSGTVDFVAVDDMAVGAAGGSQRQATVAVRWRDHASGATFAQTYQITFEAAAGKWLVAGLQPNP